MPAAAGVGTTSAGVTTTDPNSPSTEVQQQSSEFVAANQQSQNGTTSGITLPAGVAGTTQSGQTGSGNADAKGAQAGQAGGSDATAQHATPAAPPPPPPPTYESRIRPVNSTPVEAPVPTSPAASTPSVQKPEPKPEKPAQKPRPEPAVAPAGNPNRTAPVEKKQEAPMIPTTTDPGGGRGEAPDGYTFWFGLFIAGALLALAAVTYLRIRRGETPA
jgi:hypothetical protein